MDTDRIYWEEILQQGASITIATMIVPVIVSLFYKKYWNRALLAIFWYYLATLLLNLLEKLIMWACRQNLDVCIPILDYWEITNSHWLSILYFTKDYIFLGWFFSLIFPDKRLRKIIKWTTIFIALASVINYCFIEGYKGFGVFNPAINMIYVFSLPTIYLWYSQRESLRIPLKKNPYFWISIGLLIPSLMVLFIYFSGDHIFESDFRLFVILKCIENVFAILGFGLACIGFSRARFARFITTEDSSEAEESDSLMASQ
jgi:hypothetical protein